MIQVHYCVRPHIDRSNGTAMATKSAAQVVRIVVVCCLLGGIIGTPQQDILDEHNAWRSEVGSPALTWDADIAAIAQEWADNLKDTNDCGLEHRSNSDLSSKYSAGYLGENLYNSWTSQSSLSKTGIDAVAAWASEKNDYNYGPQGNACTKKNGAAVGHYTQVTWHKSAKVGCGWATCSPSSGGTSGVWVCNYYPGGNFVGEYPFCEANVPTGMTKCATISATGQPTCGTKCGSCADLSACCSCSIDDACKADPDPGATAPGVATTAAATTAQSVVDATGAADVTTAAATTAAPDTTSAEVATAAAIATPEPSSAEVATAAATATPEPSKHTLIMTMTLSGMTEADWSTAAQTAFIEAVAALFGQDAADVWVSGVSAVRRRRTRTLLQSTGLEVNCWVDGFDSIEAAVAAKKDFEGKTADLVKTLQENDAFRGKLTGIELPDVSQDVDAAPDAAPASTMVSWALVLACVSAALAKF